MLQSVSLSALQPAAANPRRKIDRKAIEGLAASIRTDGVLHNLVVSPVGKGKKERFQIVSGSRRFEALRLLQERGELPEDFTVAVEIRDDLSKDDTLRIATVENTEQLVVHRVQRSVYSTVANSRHVDAHVYVLIKGFVLSCAVLYRAE